MHFGLVMVLNLMIGLLHPPMGLVLFVLARVAKLSVERTTMAILPWLVPLLISLALITYVPINQPVAAAAVQCRRRSTCYRKSPLVPATQPRRRRRHRAPSNWCRGTLAS